MDNTSYLLPLSSTVIDALKLLNELSGTSTTIFVVNANNCVVGTITDGDLRRSLVNGVSLLDGVDKVMHQDFTAFKNGKIDIATIRIARNKGIRIVPLLNEKGELTAVIDFNRLKSILPIDAVLMAGGKGERLRPLTLETPKPLLKIDNKCIIDYNIETLTQYGISNIHVTTNYLSQQIENHFSTPIATIHVKCVKEPKRLGTIGSTKLISDWQHSDILVMNADLLTSINLEEFYLCHSQSNAMLTVASFPYTVSVPYAILQDEDGNVTGLTEKPTYNYFANAGIYLLKRECLNYIPDDEYFDATDLIETLLNHRCKVKRFTINGTWIDIGSPDDFRQAQLLIKQHRQLDF
ncbi:MAG: NTP transferase domain-containing protein [Muribaculaceae bacterium]|nr:NTP transferase domain-containing protein [Muribaculaceae bacterium]